jgi:hypothetical protein
MAEVFLHRPPVGGYHLTHDLVAGLRARSTVGDQINHGSCMPSRAMPGRYQLTRR